MSSPHITDLTYSVPQHTTLSDSAATVVVAASVVTALLSSCLFVPPGGVPRDRGGHQAAAPLHEWLRAEGEAVSSRGRGGRKGWEPHGLFGKNGSTQIRSDQFRSDRRSV